MDADERVIGLVINGEARAYPINILSSQEIVNDEVGGEVVAVTWCPLCYTALVFSRNLPGQERILSFGVSGKLLYNTLVMYDHQTESLWSQLYGAAVQGPLTGNSLALYPCLLTDWATWQAQYPASLVLSKRLTRLQFQRPSYAEAPRTSYDVDPYAGYYVQPDEGVVAANIPRDAVVRERKQRLLGIRVGNKAKAYPFRVLAQQGVINDEIDAIPVLVWFDNDSKTGTAFERRLAERVLTFLSDPADPAMLLDAETGSGWSPVTGIALTGPLQGQRLQPLAATTAFEFGWNDYFRDSDTYQP